MMGFFHCQSPEFYIFTGLLYSTFCTAIPFFDLTFPIAVPIKN